MFLKLSKSRHTLANSCVHLVYRKLALSRFPIKKVNSANCIANAIFKLLETTTNRLCYTNIITSWCFGGIDLIATE